MDPWYDGKYDGIDGRKMAVGAYPPKANYRTHSTHARTHARKYTYTHANTHRRTKITFSVKVLVISTT